MALSGRACLMAGLVCPHSLSKADGCKHVSVEYCEEEEEEEGAGPEHHQHQQLLKQTSGQTDWLYSVL